MSIPKEPRQMMINMMYLVLTALLALNVSAEVLNAFHVVNDGISNSNNAVDSKNSQTMAAFQDQLSKDKEKTQKWYDKAQETESLIAKLNKQIDEYMNLLVEKSGGWIDHKGVKHKTDWKPELGELEDDKNLEVGTHFMIEEKRAENLRKLIETTREKLLSLIDEPDMKKEFTAQLPLRIDPPKTNSEGKISSWEDANFHMVPTIACLTLLNKFKNDAKNSESQLLDYFFKKIYAKSIKVDQMEAKVIAQSSYVIAGQQYKADIFVAAYSTSITPTVYVGALNSNAVKDETGDYVPTKVNPVTGGSTIDVINGMGKYTVAASGEGEKKYAGAVMVPDAEGVPTYYPFEASYTTAKASAVVSSDNLNIIYAGIPNPFSVSVPGFSGNKVTASATGGSFTGSNGKYVANMPAAMIGKEVKINIIVDDNGQKRSIGDGQEFKVKRIPDPVAIVAGKVEGKIRTGELKASPGVIAQLKDFYFQGVTFQVTSYDFVFIAKRQDPYLKSASGWQFTSDIQSKIQGSKPGDQVIIRNIKAKGPDGSTRSLPPISLEIN